MRVVRSVRTAVRFATSRITQPHFERSTHLSVRVFEAGRLGTAIGGDLSRDGVAQLVGTARALARVSVEEPKFPGFPDGGGSAVRPTPYSRATARLTPEAVTRIAERLLSSALDAAPGARVAGLVNVDATELSVLNTSGLDRGTAQSSGQASVLVERPEGESPVSGWADGAHWDAARLKPEDLGREAAGRVARTPPLSAKPGAYRVVLASTAVADLLAFLAILGFSGHGEEEGWSCLLRRRGRRVAPPSVTLWDDPRSPLSLPLAIDFEGVPTRRLALLDHGIVGPAVTDLVTAGRLGRGLTGHGPPPEAPFGDWGPVPGNLVMKAGDASFDELVKATGNGLLVTRFHYVRTVQPGRGVITGMTRDGTYRIRRGEIAEPVRNLRFTESVLTALAGVAAIGKAAERHAPDAVSSIATCPALALRRFRFTSATLF